MIKEYKIKDILNAVDSIQKIKKKANKSTIKRNDFNEKNDILSLNKPVKTSKRFQVCILPQCLCRGNK